jgi:hypothetical protein
MTITAANLVIIMKAVGLCGLLIPPWQRGLCGLHVAPERSLYQTLQQQRQ